MLLACRSGAGTSPKGTAPGDGGVGNCPSCAVSRTDETASSGTGSPGRLELIELHVVMRHSK